MNVVQDKDRGAYALLARVAGLGAARVRVGVLDDAPKAAGEGEPEGPLSLVEVAAVHEFGAPEAGIPQRSFIRGTVDEKRGDIVTLQRQLAVPILQGKLTEEVALARLGVKVEAMVKGNIAKGIPPALAEATIEAKNGKSKPLIDTGQLRSSISHRVYREG